MSALAWKFKRLTAMDRREVLFRARQATQSQLERLGLGLAVPRAASQGSANSWVSPIPTWFDAKRYSAAGERILDGRFDIFAMRGAAIGFPPPWARDPKTGILAPLTFGKTLNYRDDRIVGDIKYLWEPNRHLELVTLAQAWHLTKDERFSQGCKCLLDSWFDQSPYPMGPNWTSSLELAIRLVNWSFAWHFLGGDQSLLFAGTTGEAFKRRWTDSIYQHCHFIAGHLSLHSSANNHLFGELTGLFVGATNWPLWKESGRWQAFSQSELELESERQIFGDGVNKEQATWYHHSVADMMLLAGLIGRANDSDFSNAFWQRFERMIEFIAAIMDFAGQMPSFGDSDDGVMVRLCPSQDFNVFRSLLATASLLFDRQDFKFKASRLDDKTRWLLGDGADERFNTLARQDRPSASRLAFPEGGYYVLGENFDTPREIKIVADAGPLGYLSIAAHGHADALAFTMSTGGQQMLVDSGTFAYHTQRNWRDYFRGTSAHNTVRVDAQDQSVSGGNFLWLKHANATCVELVSDEAEDRLLATHDGYERLADPVQHHRQFRFDKMRSTLFIKDRMTCRGSHGIEIFWHFATDCDVRISDRDIVANNGRANLTIKCPASLTPRIAPLTEASPVGWVSPNLDTKLPSICVAFCGNITGSSEFETRIAIRFFEEPSMDPAARV